jgi:hypothetical protein
MVRIAFPGQHNIPQSKKRACFKEDLIEGNLLTRKLDNGTRMRRITQLKYINILA